MPCDPVADFPRQVEAPPLVLEHVHDPQALLVVVEAAGNQIVQHALAGMPERGVPEIVAERDGLGQFLVQPQHLRDAARDLRDLERVREPGAIVIAGRGEEDLGLVLQPPERLAVDDTVTIALERRADRIFLLRPQTTARVAALGGLWCEDLPLPLFELFANAGHWLVEYVRQEALAVIERTDAEQLAERLAEIGEGAP
jgi:hypothetical protein